MSNVLVLDPLPVNDGTTPPTEAPAREMHTIPKGGRPKGSKDTAPRKRRSKAEIASASVPAASPGVAPVVDGSSSGLDAPSQPSPASGGSVVVSGSAVDADGPSSSSGGGGEVAGQSMSPAGPGASGPAGAVVGGVVAAPYFDPTIGMNGIGSYNQNDINRAIAGQLSGGAPSGVGAMSVPAAGSRPVGTPHPLPGGGSPAPVTAGGGAGTGIRTQSGDQRGGPQAYLGPRDGGPPRPINKKTGMKARFSRSRG
jgi:hypothetical protein